MEGNKFQEFFWIYKPEYIDGDTYRQIVDMLDSLEDDRIGFVKWPQWIKGKLCALPRNTMLHMVVYDNVYKLASLVLSEGVCNVNSQMRYVFSDSNSLLARSTYVNLSDNITDTDVNSKFTYKMLSALSVSIIKCNDRMIDLLLYYGAKVSTDDIDFAIENGHICRAIRLISSYTNLAEHKCFQYLPPSAFKGEQALDAIQRVILGNNIQPDHAFEGNFLASIPGVQNTWSRDIIVGARFNFTLLHQVCVGALPNVKHIIDFLVTQGSNINLVTTGDIVFTPLHFALCFERWDTAKYLISIGADLNVFGYVGKKYKNNMIGTACSLGSRLYKPHQLLLFLGCGGIDVLHDFLLAGSERGIEISQFDFQLSIEGGHPQLILRVLLQLEDMGMVNETLNKLEWPNTMGINYIRICPSLSWFASVAAARHIDETEDLLPTIRSIFVHLLSNNYDCNSIATGLPQCYDNIIYAQLFSPLIFSVITLERYINDGLISDLILANEHVLLSVFHKGQTPIDFILIKMEGTGKSSAIKSKMFTLLRNLVDHGFWPGIKNINLGAFEVFDDILLMFKLLHCFGVRWVLPSMNPHVIAHNVSNNISRHPAMLKNLLDWRKNYDASTSNGFNLQLLCIHALRSSCKSVGDFKDVLCQLPQLLSSLMTYRTNLLDIRRHLKCE